ncbi:MAG: GNAT family N-acetyltransferase [Pyrinomonadaceae bacterium]
MEGNFAARPLRTEDGPELSALLLAQAPEYVRYFTPFAFDRETVSRTLARRDQDVFTGFYWRSRLVGFFMLRGWDEGYDVPAYGVLVDEQFGGYGLATVSLRMAKAVCKLSGAPRIMLKVHPANERARRIFERAGFVRVGTDPEGEKLIYHFNL